MGGMGMGGMGMGGMGMMNPMMVSCPLLTSAPKIGYTSGEG
jgi:hypothetical protein